MSFTWTPKLHADCTTAITKNKAKGDTNWAPTKVTTAKVHFFWYSPGVMQPDGTVKGRCSQEIKDLVKITGYLSWDTFLTTLKGMAALRFGRELDWDIHSSAMDTLDGSIVIKSFGEKTFVHVHNWEAIRAYILKSKY